MVLLSMFLFIYNILNISLEKDLQRYGLLQVIGVEQKQNIKVMNREMLKIGLTGSIAGAVLGGMFIWGIMPLLLEKMYAENTWKLERMVFFQPKLYPSDCSCDFHVGSGSGMSEKKNEEIKSVGVYEIYGGGYLS